MAKPSTLESLTSRNDNFPPPAPQEDEVTKKVEQQTARVPSIGYLGLAIGSMALSAGLAIFADRKPWANFVGLWAPTFLLLGVYSKLVKLEEKVS